MPPKASFAQQDPPEADVVRINPSNGAGASNPALRVRAYELFREQLLNGTLRAGQFVSQRELSALLNVPLGAIREMIPRLEAARLMLTVPQRGLQIAHIDLKLVRNAFQVRTMIEREAVQNFVRTASNALLDEQERRHRAILARVKPGKADASLDKDSLAVDWAFHDLMVDAMDNEILSDIYRTNSLHIQMIRLDALKARNRLVAPSMEEHLELIAKIKARDEDAAVRSLTKHLEQSKTRVVNAMLGDLGQYSTDRR